MADDDLTRNPDPAIVQLYYRTIAEKVTQLDSSMERQREATARQLERLEHIAQQQMREMAAAADQKIKESVVVSHQQVAEQALQYDRALTKIQADVLAMAKDLGEYKIEHLKLKMETDYALATAKTVGSHLVKFVIGVLTTLLVMMIVWYVSRTWQTTEIVRQLQQSPPAPRRAIPPEAP
jgi:hypothetical protein